MKISFKCEQCNKEFEKRNDCEEHEYDCIDIKNKQLKEVKKAVQTIWREYGDQIDDISYKTNSNLHLSGDNDVFTVVNFEIHIELQNGNKVYLGDGMISLGNFTTYEDIIILAQNEINIHLSTTYQGEIWIDDEDGWYNPKIGDVELLDIARRLYGQKVKLEVIKD